MADLPAGIVTLCFTDIEGSTQLLRSLGEAYDAVLDEHYAILRGEFAPAGGVEVRSEGDALFVVFRAAGAAVTACARAQQRLRSFVDRDIALRVRMGLHTGEVHVVDGDLRGLAIHQASRIVACAHGGQIVCSSTTAHAIAEATPSGVGLLDLGRHRVRDFAEPEAIHQVVADGLQRDFPALRTAPVAGHEIPAARTSLVGRDRAQRDVEKLCETARLVTLVGPGGIGKTRLATEVVRELADDRRDGAVAVYLADVSEPDLVTGAIAARVGVRPQPGVAITEAIGSAMEPRDLIVLLDNCEHVVEACADVVDALLDRAPAVTVIATSRRPLGVRGEAVYAVPPLEIPDGADGPEAVAAIDSVRLFVDRAIAGRPSFTLTPDNSADVVKICRHLDGLPLAIEVAAARVRSMPVRALASRIQDTLGVLTVGPVGDHSRHRTMRALVGWSYDLLTPLEQVLFRRLSVFRGGFDIDALEEVGGGDPVPAEAVLDLLHSLVDQSLVVLDEGERYGVLVAISDFAAEQLAASDEEPSIRERHLRHFAAVARAAADGLEGPDHVQWTAAFDEEAENIRAALTWGLDDAGDRPTGARLAAATAGHWLRRGRLDEANAWMTKALGAVDGDTRRTVLLAAARVASARSELTRAVELAGEARAEAARAQDEPAVVRALILLGNAAFFTGDAVASVGHLTDALGRAKTIGDRAGATACLLSLSNVHRATGDVDAARACVEEGMAMARTAGDATATYRFLINGGNVSRMQGRLGEAAARYEEALVLAEEAGDLGPAMLCLINRGDIAREEGQLAAASARVERALALARGMGDRAGIGACLDKLGEIATAEGEHGRALARYEEAAALARGIGDRRLLSHRLMRIGDSLRDLGDAEAARARTAEALELARATNDGPAVRGCLRVLAELALEAGDADAADLLATEALAATRPLGNPVFTATRLLLLVQVARRLGDHRRAQDLLDEATELASAAANEELDRELAAVVASA